MNINLRNLSCWCTKGGDTCSSVSPRINIHGAGVHQWYMYMTFGQQCSIGVIKQCFSA